MMVYSTARVINTSTWLIILRTHSTGAKMKSNLRILIPRLNLVRAEE